jgi:hypothetical protein
MTRTFPLGSCKMPSFPTLPYELKFESMNRTNICLRVLEVERYKDICAQLNIYDQCNNMIVDLKKLVFWYRHTNECGYQNTIRKEHLNVFPWITDNGTRVGRYRFISPLGKRGASGDLALFKFKPDNQSMGNIEITIAKSNPLRLSSDTTMHNYLLCLDYNNATINMFKCISNDEPRIRYSFYDPYKSLCTVGSIFF